ncbi:fatty acid desaturase [Streptomyces sp. NPDC037389]|uniref:fatty acid desaturase n=1 Tax=Streptomyces sp. NPDC037389 TaxID=3155369 RepID=UPI0033D7733C
MLTCLVVIAAGIVLRQIDRYHFARSRPRVASARELIALQRARANDWTPALLLVGQWVQIAGWWLLAGHGPVAAVVAVVGVAVQFRHLQEVSHFAVHGVLARSARVNRVLAEALVHLPLGLVPVAVRRRRHVRDHHPNATLAADPNLAELRDAGLVPGASRLRFVLALLFPLTPRGIRATVTGIAANLRRSPGRAAVVAAVLAAAFLVGGPAALVCGVLVPRLLLYPLLAWGSLIVEHTWFDPEPRTGSPAWVEAGRCMRLYPYQRLLAALAVVVWLPYGDLYHYAHSAHSSVRWNYLSALERHLAPPHFMPAALLWGPGSVVRQHWAALTPPSAAGAAPRRRVTRAA